MSYIFDKNKHKIYRGMRYTDRNNDFVIVDIIKSGKYKSINLSDFDFYKANHHTLYNRYKMKYSIVTSKTLHGKEVY